MFFNLEFSIELKGFSQFVLYFKNYVSYCHLKSWFVDQY